MREKEHLLQVILQSKVEHFVFDFLNYSKSIFLDNDGNLIHPGEFGTYREKICIDLLRSVVPMRLDFGTGFIVDMLGNVSHQCDIIIYDSQNTPLIENNEKQRFFPIETVVGVGEIKSELSRAKLIEALHKLANLKKMRKNIEPTRSMIFEANNRQRNYQPDLNPRDQLFTFLICDSLSFKNEELVNEFNEMYEGINPRFKHNLILSVKDGAFMYCDENKKAIYYPNIKDDILRNCKVGPFEVSDINPSYTKFAHIHSFMNYMYQGIANATILYPELSYYIINGLHKNIIVEGD